MNEWYMGPAANTYTNFKLKLICKLLGQLHLMSFLCPIQRKAQCETHMKFLKIITSNY